MRILYTAMIGTNCTMAVITANNIAPMSSRRLVPAISINRASPVLRLFVSIALLFIRLFELPSFYPLLFLPKIAIQSFLCQKSLMLALLHHPSLVYHYNIIGTYHRAQAMSDDDYSLFFHQVVDSILDVNLVFGIERSGCLVKQHDGRIFQNGTGNRDTLFLSTG